MILALILLQVADAISTILVLRSGGREKNPIIAWCMGKIGVIPALLATKIPLTAAAVWALQQHSIATYVFAPVLALYAWAVWNNFRVYRKLSK